MKIIAENEVNFNVKVWNDSVNFCSLNVLIVFYTALMLGLHDFLSIINF